MIGWHGYLELSARDGFAELCGDCDLAGHVFNLAKHVLKLVPLVQHLLLLALVFFRDLCDEKWGRRGTGVQQR